jgi:hypothetical protein
VNLNRPGRSQKNHCIVRRLTSTAAMLALGVLIGVGLGAEEAEACANAAARTAQSSEGLPDCRAYERATPPDKSGADATGTAFFVKAARDGDGVTYLSQVSRSALTEYTPNLALRGEGDWSSAGLLPPPHAGQSSELVGETPDLKIALYSQREGEEATALVARLALSGELRTIVPFTKNLAPRFVGATEDDSLVVFESPAALPGAGPALAGWPNLYAWEPAGGEIRQIAVLNDGKTPAEGAFGGPYDWLQGPESGVDNGGAARNYYTEDEHVVAADGSAVYFTAAGTGEIYLRRNPGSAQSPLDSAGGCVDPGLACTIKVSASRRGGGADDGDSGPAAFMGAGADGGVAYFTSPEKLTDDANTGPEAQSPHLSRGGIGGGPAGIERSFIPVSAKGVAVDGSHLYWANPARGSIGRANLDGTGVDEAFVSGLAQPLWVAVNDEYVYWTAPGNGGSIGRAKLDGGGAPEPEFITGAGKPQGIAVDTNKIYWADDAPNGIGRANLDGTGIEPTFHPLRSVEIPQGVAVDGSHVYWTENEPGGYVSRADLDGTDETYLYAGPTEELRGIALDGGYVYWAALGGGVVGRAGLDLRESETHFVDPGEQPFGLAVDASNLYWSVGRSIPPGNDLYRYEAESGGLTDLTPDQDDPNGAEVQGALGVSENGAYVYFVANGVLASGSNANGEIALPGDCQGHPGAATGSCNLYASHGDTVEFIARLQADDDAINWAPTPMGVSSLSSFQPTARVSADGRTLLFRSSRRLSAYPNEGVAELYRYRLGEPGPICVSCDPNGAPPTGAATLATISPPTAYRARPAGMLTHNLSADGNRVFFESVDPLVEADRNGEEGCPPVGLQVQSFPACQDVYEWEAAGTGSCPAGTAAGCLYLLSRAEAGRPAFFADASRGGDDAFIFTPTPLVGQDRDELIDVYDARVEGGIAGQSEPAVRCAGEECRPPPSIAPALPAPATGGLGPARAHRHPHRRCRSGKRSGHRHRRAGARNCARGRVTLLSTP